MRPKPFVPKCCRAQYGLNAAGPDRSCNPGERPAKPVGRLSTVHMKPRLLADWQNADTEGRIRLNMYGNVERIDRLGDAMASGLEVVLDDGDEFEADGVIEWSATERIWVAQPSGLRERTQS